MGEIRSKKDDGDDSVTTVAPPEAVSREAQEIWSDRSANMSPEGRTPRARLESKTLPIKSDDMPILEITGAPGQPQPSPSNPPSDGGQYIPAVKTTRLDPDFLPRGLVKVDELEKPMRPGDRSDATDSRSPESMTDEEIARTHAERLARIEENKFFRLAELEQQKAERLIAIENERVAALRKTRADMPPSKEPSRPESRLRDILNELNRTVVEPTPYSSKTGK